MSTVTALKPPTVQLPPLPVQQGPGQVDQLPKEKPTLVTTVLKNAAIFGGIGAVAGAALSFTALPIVGALTAPIAAAIGGAAGVLVGVIKGIFDHRKQDDSPVGQLPPSVPVGVITPPPLPPGLPPA